jgi:hypothetical protein
LGKAEPKLGKTEPEQGCEVGLREDAKPTSVERFKEESIMKKDEAEKDGLPLDEGRMKPITEGDSVKGGDTIRSDWSCCFWSALETPKRLWTRRLSGKL